MNRVKDPFEKDCADEFLALAKKHSSLVMPHALISAALSVAFCSMLAACGGDEDEAIQILKDTIDKGAGVLEKVMKDD